MFESVRERQLRAWEQIAEYWDREVVGRAADAKRWSLPDAPLDDVRPGDVVLDVGCGNGEHARRYAGRGASVVAVDATPAFLDIAQARSQGLDIEYRRVDATDEAQLLALGESRFDLIASRMVLMNLPDVDAMFSASARLLKPGGALFCTLRHPCFPSPGLPDIGPAGKQTWTARLQRVATRAYNLAPAPLQRLSIAMLRGMHATREWEYFTPTIQQFADDGQPVPHLQFHRPLGLLLEPAFRAGLLLDGLQEFGTPRRDGRPPASPWGLTLRFRRP